MRRDTRSIYLVPGALTDRGVLCVEDLHAIYRAEQLAANPWLPAGQQVAGTSESFVRRSKGLVDALHVRHMKEPNNEASDANSTSEIAWAHARDFAYRTEAIHFFESVVCLEKMPEQPNLETRNAGDFHFPFRWSKDTAGNEEVVTREGTHRTIGKLRERYRERSDGSGLTPEHLADAIHLSPQPLKVTGWNTPRHSPQRRVPHHRLRAHGNLDHNAFAPLRDPSAHPGLRGG